MHSGIRWTVTDRYGNSIYLTEERWQHIIEPLNHPEVEDYEDYLQLTLKQGRHRQEPLNPRKYRYFRHFEDLPGNVNHFIVIVLFGFTLGEQGQTFANNYVATAFFKYIQPKR